MAKKEPLLELIRSLTPPEKRYFKVNAESIPAKGGKAYLTLFNLIEKHDLCDRKILEGKKELAELNENFSFHKNYLYNQILRSLRAFHSKRDGYIKLQELLTEIHILNEKKLFRQAEKRLRAAKKIAAKFHYDLTMIKLLTLERSMIRGYAEKKSYDQVLEVQKETHQYLDQLVNWVQITDLYDRVFLLARNQSIREEHLDGLIQQITREKETLDGLHFSFEGKLTYHLLFATYYQIFGKETDRSLGHLKALIEYFEANENLLSEYTHRYINLLNNYLNFFFLKNDFSPFREAIDKLKRLNSKSKFVELKLFHTIYHLELVYSLRTGQYEKAISLVPEIEKGLKKYGDKIPKLNRLILRQNTTLAFFHQQNHDEALKWARSILDEGRHEIRQDVHLFCRLLQLMIHFELEEFEMVDYHARSIIRLVNTIESPEPFVLFANEVAKNVRKAAASPPHRVGKIFFALRNRLNRDKVYINGKEEVVIWLDRQLAG